MKILNERVFSKQSLILSILDLIVAYLQENVFVISEVLTLNGMTYEIRVYGMRGGPFIRLKNSEEKSVVRIL